MVASWGEVLGLRRGYIRRSKAASAALAGSPVEIAAAAEVRILNQKVGASKRPSLLGSSGSGLQLERPCSHHVARSDGRRRQGMRRQGVRRGIASRKAPSRPACHRDEQPMLVSFPDGISTFLEMWGCGARDHPRVCGQGGGCCSHFPPSPISAPDFHPVRLRIVPTNLAPVGRSVRLRIAPPIRSAVFHRKGRACGKNFAHQESLTAATKDRNSAAAGAFAARAAPNAATTARSAPVRRELAPAPARPIELRSETPLCGNHAGCKLLFDCHSRHAVQ